MLNRPDLFFRSFILLFLYFCKPVPGGVADDFRYMALLANATVAVGERYFSVCTVILHPYDINSMPWDIFAFLKLLSASSYDSCLISRNFTDYLTYMEQQSQQRCPRTMNVIIGDDRLTKKYFSEVRTFMNFCNLLVNHCIL